MSIQDQLIEFSIQEIVYMITSDEHIPVDRAMEVFYNSEVFEKLQDKETGLYIESPLYVYELFKDEQKNGRIVQEEE